MPTRLPSAIVPRRATISCCPSSSGPSTPLPRSSISSSPSRTRSRWPMRSRSSIERTTSWAICATAPRSTASRYPRQGRLLQTDQPGERVMRLRQSYHLTMSKSSKGKPAKAACPLHAKVFNACLESLVGDPAAGLPGTGAFSKAEVLKWLNLEGVASGIRWDTSFAPSRTAFLRSSWWRSRRPFSSAEPGSTSRSCARAAMAEKPVGDSATPFQALAALCPRRNLENPPVSLRWALNGMPRAADGAQLTVGGPLIWRQSTMGHREGYRSASTVLRGSRPSMPYAAHGSR